MTTLPPLPEHGSTAEKASSAEVGGLGASCLGDGVVASEATAAGEIPLAAVVPSTKRRRLRRTGDINSVDADLSLVVVASSTDVDVER